MKVSTFGRKVNLRQSFNDKAEKRLQKLDRFFEDDAAAGQVTVTQEKDRFKVDITVKSRGFIYRAEKASGDMDEAFGDAADLIVRQIVKNKDRLGARVKKAAVEAETEKFGDVAPVLAGEYEVAREKHFELKPLSTEEAILQMNMLGHNFFLYSDADTDEIRLVYKRKGDSYGILVPGRD